MTSLDRSRLPQPGSEPPFRFPEVIRRSLGNGLRVWTVEHRDVPVLSCVLLLGAGSAADPEGRPGLAAFTADMLDEGSGDRSALDVEDALARLGAQFDTEVGSDATVLSLLTLSRCRDAALGLLADMAARPRLDDADFERLRELRLRRLVQVRDLAPVLADRALARLLYPVHPYGHLPLGTTASLQAVTPDELKGFHRAVWRPDRLTLILAGDATHDEMFAAADRAFGWWAPAGDADPAAIPDVVPTPVPAAPSARVAIVDRPGAAQSELRIGQVAVPRVTPDYHSLIVLNAILGGQFVSRLNMNLRENKGYTYGARSCFDFRRAPGPFVMQAAVQTRVTAAAAAEALREVGDLAGARPATPAELELAQSSLTRGYPRNFETAIQVARGLAQLALYDLPDDTIETFVPSVRGVRAETVTEAARRLHPSTMVVAVVGDRAEVEAGLRELGMGEPEALEREV